MYVCVLDLFLLQESFLLLLMSSLLLSQLLHPLPLLPLLHFQLHEEFETSAAGPQLLKVFHCVTACLVLILVVFFSPCPKLFVASHLPLSLPGLFLLQLLLFLGSDLGCGLGAQLLCLLFVLTLFL